MTEVLSLPSQPDGGSYFGSDPIRRSPSQSSFLLHSPPSYAIPTPKLKSRYGSVGYDTRLPASLPSSAPSSPALTHTESSRQASFASTPSSSLSLDEQCSTEEEDDIMFPSYGDGGYHHHNEEPKIPSSPQNVSPESTPPASSSSTASVSPPTYDIPKPTSSAGDDTSLRTEPTRHVDYLSHNWKEEDIWSSWRHIVAKRKVYSNSPRLENASWRTWTKAKYRLRTVSPETLNWLKDHDVTWLYGPLQTGASKTFNSDVTPPASPISRSSSFSAKKPILKRRSLSEIMLQRSLSTSTLMKQATDALRSQSPADPLRARLILAAQALDSFFDSTNSETPPITLVSSSVSTSGAQTPSTKRHIHFNDEVEQCIAINKDADDHEGYEHAIRDEHDSSDEEELLTMKPVPKSKGRISNGSTPRSSFNCESKTIAMLPSTTLKYRGDTPDPEEQQLRQKGDFWSMATKLSPSPSQETIRPSTPSTNFLLNDDDEDADMTWQPSTISADRRKSISPGQLQLGSLPNSSNDEKEASGLRRTSSGMFMPYEEDGDVGSAGLLGRVVDTVNTAKDIAHVIWNVGWRR